MVTDPVKWEIVLAKSGVVLTGKKNGKRVSLRLRAFVVRVDRDRGVNFGWIVKREGHLV